MGAFNYLSLFKDTLTHRLSYNNAFPDKLFRQGKVNGT